MADKIAEFTNQEWKIATRVYYHCDAPQLKYSVFTEPLPCGTKTVRHFETKEEAIVFARTVSGV